MYICTSFQRYGFSSSAEHGNLEVPAYFSKAKQGYTVIKMKKHKWIQYILISASLKFWNKKKFQYGILVYTSPF
jgi:hypothetical protein